jgi:hypothetical protein
MSQGVYHVFNVAKMRIMEATYQNYPSALSTKEIAKITGMEHGKVSRLLTHYHYHNYHYFRRLKKKDSNGGYRYKINRKGLKAYFAFVLRIKQGYDLNLNRQIPIKMETYRGLKKVKIKSERDLILKPEELSPYVRLSHRGEHELGVRKEDALKIVGIIKEEPVKEPVEPEVTEEPELPEVSDMPEKPETPVLLPSKTYQTKQGTLTSEQMAKIIVEAIEYANEQIQSTTDARKIKKLTERIRSIKLWLAMHPDVGQYIQ